MTLHSTVGVPERILVYGQEGAGKTRTYWAIAKRMRQTQAPGVMHVFDLDWAWKRMAIGYPGYEQNMVVYTPDSFAEFVGKLADVVRKAGVDDWLVIDGLGEAWNEAKEHVIRTAYNNSMSDYLTEQLGGKSDFGKTTDVQNKTWREVSKWVVKFPGHVIGCAPARSVFKVEGEQDANKVRYSQIGWQPDTQKMIGYLFHTVVYLADVGNLKQDMWVMTTVKDRERKKVVNMQVGDFCMDYLVKIAGWEL